METKLIDPSRERLRKVVYAAFESLALDGVGSLHDDLSFGDLGVDSLGMGQAVLCIEEETGRAISDDELERLSQASNLGEVCDILHEAFSVEAT
jgi:acyl carrier protein